MLKLSSLAIAAGAFVLASAGSAIAAPGWEDQQSTQAQLQERWMDTPHVPYARTAPEAAGGRAESAASADMKKIEPVDTPNRSPYLPRMEQAG